MKHDPKAGTTDQKPKWEGPPENRPRGYEPADDNPAEKRDAAGHNLSDPNRKNLADALSEPKRTKKKGKRTMTSPSVPPLKEGDFKRSDWNDYAAKWCDH